MVSDVKNRILDAAVKLLVEQGAGALTQPRVADAAGVRQSHLTYYFPRRTDLLLAVTMHWAKAHLESDAQRLQQGRITRGDITRYLADAVTEAGRVRIILGLMIASEEDHRIKESLRAFIESERESIGSMLAGLGLEADSQQRALVHATLVGFAVLFLARGSEAERETRALTRYWLEELVPAIVKPAKRRSARGAGRSKRKRH